MLSSQDPRPLSHGTCLSVLTCPTLQVGLVLASQLPWLYQMSAQQQEPFTRPRLTSSHGVTSGKPLFALQPLLTPPAVEVAAVTTAQLLLGSPWKLGREEGMLPSTVPSVFCINLLV